MKKFGLILIFIVFFGALFGVTVYYKDQIASISKVLETERYSRLVAEEKVINSVSKIQQLQDELTDNQDKMAKIQNLLKEQKTVNKDLDSQFQKLSKAKSQLETQIQTLISDQALAAAEAKQAPQNNETVQSNEVAQAQ